jgi:hypothetical protein
VRKAKVRIESVRVMCPYCGEPALNDEGDNPNECASMPPGEVTCEDCGKKFLVPDFTRVFNRQIRCR